MCVDITILAIHFFEKMRSLKDAPRRCTENKSSGKRVEYRIYSQDIQHIRILIKGLGNRKFDERYSVSELS